MKSNKKTILQIRFFIIFQLIFLIVTGCQKEKPPVKIGFAVNLTPATTLSIGARNGALMAVDDINASGGINGHPIQLIIKDDRLDPETAKKVDQELIRENVAAIIGHIHSPVTLSTVPLANQAKMVMISPIAATSKLTGIDDYFFRINPPSIDTTIKIARYAFDNGLKKLAGTYDLKNKAYAETKYLEFKNAFEAIGGKILKPLPFSSGEGKSLPDLVQKMTAKNPDGYFIVAGPLDSAMICQHLRKIDTSRPILASSWLYDREFIKNAGTAAEGVVFSHSFQLNSTDPSFLEFKKNFMKRYNATPLMWETYGYEGVMVLSQAFSLNPDPKQLKETLLKVRRFKGLQGEIYFDQYGDNHKPPLLFTVKNGEFIEIH